MTLFGAIQHQEDVPVHFEWLHPLEIAYLETLRFDKRRLDWLLGRWTSKVLLQQVLCPDAPLSEIEIRKGQNREPLVYLKEELAGCRLSISHSHGKAFCVLSRDNNPVGCDLEKVESRSELFIRDYFTEREHRLFTEKYSQVFGRDAFYTLLWSAKESVMKACLSGLSIPAKNIDLQEIKGFNADSWSEISLENRVSKALYHGFFKLGDGFAWAVLAEVGQGDPSPIKLEWVG